MNSGDPNSSGAASYQTLTRPNSKDVRRQLDIYLRGEISAAEAYRIALEAMQSNRAAPVDLTALPQIQQEHRRAVQALRDHIRQLGGESSKSSGLWGTWAKLTASVANLFGDAASLKALKEGEELGLHQYEAAFDEIDMTSSELISDQLIPAQQRHIAALDHLIKTANAA